MKHKQIIPLHPVDYISRIPELSTTEIDDDFYSQAHALLNLRRTLHNEIKLTNETKL